MPYNRNMRVLPYLMNFRLYVIRLAETSIFWKPNSQMLYSGAIWYPHSTLDWFQLMSNFVWSTCSREKFNTSFESPNKKLLELGKKMGLASSWGWPRPLNWKSTTFTRTHMEPLMIEIYPVSNIFSINTL